MQNGVNIDVSVDKGVDILRNDVDAILEQIINDTETSNMEINIHIQTN